MPPRGKKSQDASAKRADAGHGFPGQVVLVLQGGGALGAYQVGVFEAMHDAGIEPDWVIGTSIGAINGAIIAGNPVTERMARLEELWSTLTREAFSPVSFFWPGFEAGLDWRFFSDWRVFMGGIAGFFAPNPLLGFSLKAPVGVERAAFYATDDLRKTLEALVDSDFLNAGAPRLTVGAVSTTRGAMRYFDSKREMLGIDHVMASSALPPAFPAVSIEGEAYWDGGVYSNTPVEAVFDDYPRCDSVVFTVQMWNPAGPEPQSLWDVFTRQKDIQYASRAGSHIVRQAQIHHLRHIVRELGARLPKEQKTLPEVMDMAGYGCATTMHMVRLVAPRLDGEDQFKDIDFTPGGVGARRQAGYEDMHAMLARRPWAEPVDPKLGVVVHNVPGND
ncbi:MAG: patatin-like phospholipase family protein [Pseudomonadota bacterium]